MRGVQALAPASPLVLTAAAAAGALGVAAMFRGTKELKPTVQGQSTAWNSAILSLCPALTAHYRQPGWMPRGGHFETILAAWFRWGRAARLHPPFINSVSPVGLCRNPVKANQVGKQPVAGRSPTCCMIARLCTCQTAAAWRWTQKTCRPPRCGGGVVAGLARAGGWVSVSSYGGGEQRLSPATLALPPPAVPQQLPQDAPVLILLPGLTGGSEDSYVQHAVVS